MNRTPPLKTILTVLEESYLNADSSVDKSPEEARAWMDLIDSVRFHGFRICDMYYPSVPPMDIEDVLSTVIEKLLDRKILRRICTVDNPDGYLVTMLRHAIVDHFRQLGRDGDKMSIRDHEAITERAEPETEDSPPDPVRLERWHSVLESLTSEERDLLELFYIAGWKIEEIAEQIGKKYSATAKQLSRLRIHISQALENMEENGRN